MEVYQSVPSHLQISYQEALISSQNFIFNLCHLVPLATYCRSHFLYPSWACSSEVVKQPRASLCPGWSDFLQMPAITGMWLRTSSDGRNAIEAVASRSPRSCTGLARAEEGGWKGCRCTEQIWNV